MKISHPLLLVFLTLIARAHCEEPWRFIVLADWHSAEKYTRSEDRPDWFQAAADADVAAVKMLKQNYGGDLILLPGDSNGGHWKGNTILKKGRLCYSGMVQSFENGGYTKLLMAVGDHELGDNPWPVNSDKSKSQPLFRKAFADVFNVDPRTRKFRYPNPIGAAPPRPVGTIFESTSYAYKHKNVLFVTVDVFRQDTASKGIGTQGTVTGSVTGEHLEWLDSVLFHGSKHPDISHIFVQSHLPVIHPVRKVNSSGMLMDDDVESEFWKVLRKHKVDIYFAGEVHANTVTKDPESDLVQIVSRGNFFSNFLTVDVTDDQIKVTCHNQTGPEPSDGKYVESGKFILKKTGEKAEIEGSGELALLDRRKALMHFDFEERSPLSSRPVIGQAKKGTTKKIALIDGVNCSESFANQGVFDQQYDAHFAAIPATGGPVGKAGEFSAKSRMAVFAMGPHYPGRPTSYALWVKTTSADPMVLINTGSIWKRKLANFMNLNLRDGKPEIMISKSQRLVADAAVNDGKWHHVAVSADKDGTTLSELSFYIDGKPVKTKLIGNDKVLATVQSVRISVGCFGYSRDEFRKLGVRPFTGAIDEVMIWTRGLDAEEVRELSKQQ